MGTAAIAVLRTVARWVSRRARGSAFAGAVGFFALFPSWRLPLLERGPQPSRRARRSNDSLDAGFGLTLATLFLDERMVSHHWIGAGLIALVC